MAATLAPDGTPTDKLYVSFPISKFEDDADGNLIVYGKATDESVDSDEQIVKGDWSGPALQKWLSTGGNVRVQHNPALYPAGKGLTVEETPDGHYVKALVVEDTAKKLVKNKVLQAYSVGISRPQVERDITGKARGGIIKGGEIFEVSLVDRPANKNCGITLSKSYDALTKSADGSVTEQWTYGDLESFLIQSEIVKAHSPELASQWAADRAAWLAEEPNPSNATMGPEYLAKRAEWQHWMAKGQSEGLVEDGYSDWVAKRQMDRNVGGGVDRDKIPAEDFAGRDRSFPIVTPGDVSDAASSIGRAGSDNYSSDQLKKNIIRIARRKGDAFVAALPESWKDGKGKMADDVTVEKAKKPKKGGKPSFMIGVNEGGKKTDEIPVKKGDDGECPGCGKSMDDCSCPPAETKGKKKGKKPFMSGEGSDASLGQGGDSMAKGMLNKCMCGNCGKDCDEDDLYCSQCGTALAQGGGDAEGGPATTEKSLMPTRAGGKKVKPAGRHREPDGDTSVEQLEGDAGMATDKDPVKDKVPASVDAKGKKDATPMTYAAKRAHDALCAAFHADDVQAEYPALKSLADALTGVDFGEYQDAVDVVKGADPLMLDDLRAGLHKSFTDQYPNLRIKPGDAPTPGRFQRPYLTAGHYREVPQKGSAGKKIPNSSKQPEPQDFGRGALTAGHERPSPANKGNNPIDSIETGSSHELYAAASRDYVANAMKALHDHLVVSQAAMCSMAGTPAQMPPGNNANAHPTERQPLNTAAGAPVSTKTAMDPEALLKLVDKRARKLVKSLKKQHESEVSALKAQIDELGRQPDPTQAPFRGGAVRKAAGGPSPVEKRNLAIEAQETAAKAEQAAYVEYLAQLANSGDPEMRERAIKALTGAGVSDPYAVITK